MGKRILTQRRGKGGIQYRAAEKCKVADARYPSITSGDTVNGVIEDFVHDRARSSPLSINFVFIVFSTPNAPTLKTFSGFSPNWITLLA